MQVQERAQNRRLKVAFAVNEPWADYHVSPIQEAAERRGMRVELVATLGIVAIGYLLTRAGIEKARSKRALPES